MAERIDDLEVGVHLDPRPLEAGLRDAEAKVDKFAAKVGKKSPAVEIKLNDLNFRKGVRVINLMVREMDRKSATVSIRADTKGFVRAYAEVRLIMNRLAKLGDKNVPFFAQANNFATRFINKLGQKGVFENFARGVGGMRVQLGLFSTTMRQALGVLTVFGPIIEGVLGSVVALTGALGEGLVGATAVAGSGLTGMVATLGLVKAAITPTTKGIKAAAQAQAAYQKQVQKTGVDSDKAKTKLEELNSTMAHVPASARGAIRTWVQVSTQFRQVTRDAAETNVSKVLNAGATTAKALMPAAARQTNAAMGTIGNAAQSAGKAIRGQEISGQIDTIMSGFNRALPSLLKGFGQLGALMLRIFSAVSPMVVEGAKAFGEWATHLNNSNDDASVLEQTVGRMWERFKQIFSLLSSAGGLIKTVLKGGADEGSNLIITLDHTLQRWNKFLQTPKGQADMADFFKRAGDTAKKLGPALLQLVTNMAKFSEATKPIADSILRVIALIGKFFSLLQSVPGIGNLLALAGGFAIVAQKMGLLLPLLKLIRGALSAQMFVGALAAIGPGGWLILGLTALVLAFIAAWKHCKTFRDIMTAAFDFIKSAFVSMIDTVLGGLSSMLTAFGKIAQHIPGMKDLGKAALGAAGDIDKLRENLNKVPEKKTVKVKVTIDEVDFAGQATGNAAKNKAFTGDGIGRRVQSAVQNRVKTNKAFANKVMEGAGGVGGGPIPGGKGGNLMGADPRLGGIARIGGGFGLHVSSGRRAPGGRTSSGGISYHGSGEALDLSNGYATPEELHFFNYMKSHFGSSLAELIHTPGGVGIRNGKPFRYTGITAAQHYDHVHVAVDLPGAGAGGPASSQGNAPRPGSGPARAKLGDGPGRRSRRQRFMGDGPGKSKKKKKTSGPGIGNINRTFPKHGLSDAAGHVQFSPELVTKIAQGAGLPGRAFEQIAHGESTYYPGIVSYDDGWGLWQMTPRVWGPEAVAYMNKLGGKQAMLNPLKNAMMAKWLFDRGGFSPWFGTQFLTGQARAEGAGMKGKKGPGFGGVTSDPTLQGENADGSTADPAAGGLSPVQQKNKERWEKEITVNQSKIDTLTKKKRSLKGKKNVGARDKISNQITDLRARNRLLQDKIRALKESPTTGETSTAENAFTEAQTALDNAASSPELTDDIEAVNQVQQASIDYRKELTDRLNEVNTVLAGKQTKATRKKYLGQKQGILNKIRTLDRTVNAAKSQGIIAKVGARFAGGTGAAGLDEALQEAQNTDTLDDDIAALQNSIKYQQALAKAFAGTPARSGRGFGGRGPGARKGAPGDPKARAKALNQVGQLQKQLDKAEFDKTMSPLDYMLSVAQSTKEMGDDLGVLGQQLEAWKKLLAKRTKSKDFAGMTEAQNAINSLTESIFSAQKTKREQDVGLDVAEYAVQYADAGTNLAEQFNATHAEYAALLELEVGSRNYGRIDEANQYALRIRQAQERMAQLSKQINDQYIQGDLARISALSNVYASTETITDDVYGVSLLYNETFAAMNRAFAVGDTMAGYDLQAQFEQLKVRLRDAQYAQQDQPLQARKALAQLTAGLDDDNAVSQEMLNIAQGRLDYFKSINDYANIIKYAGEVKSLKDELQQNEQNRLESIRIMSEARQNLYRTFGSNMVSGGLAPVGTTVNVVNNYKNMPLDPHSWSRDIGFELRSAV